MVEANKLKLGLFIVISITILLSSLIALGLIEELNEKNQIFTVFDESVQGLEEGAAIKYKGVTVGRVSKISIWNERFVKVDMETDPDSVIGGKALNKQKSRSDQIRDFNDLIQKEVKNGLRCSLELSSIATGLKFIELTHIDQARKTEVDVKIEGAESEIFVPAMKSVLSGAITNFDRTLSNIAKIDYEGIGEEAKVMLMNLNKVLTNPHINSLLERGDTAAEELIAVTKNLNKQLSTLKLKEIQEDILKFTNSTNKNVSALITNTDKKLNATLESINTKVEASLDKIDSLITTFETEVKAAKIAETSKAARDTLASANDTITAVKKDAVSTLKGANQFLTDLKDLKTDVSKTLKSIEGASNSLSGMRGDIAAILKRFKITLDSITAFVEYLERDPSAIIHGKSKK